ncbi:MAG: hypothetical protein HQ580_18440 [Planctomycetes bacterium]|nr:hypothetical protein [Planctomycetota bacterium]
MKKIFVLLICGFFVFLPGGCQSSVGSKSGVEVIIDGDGRFPEILAGRWKADKGGWEIVFEPDGKISSVVVSLGGVRMKPGQVTTTQMVLGGEGLFKPGKWTVQYSKERRELIVEIAIEHFRVELGDNVVQGKTRDYFVGSVSADGRLWWADRYKFPEYVVDTKKHPNYKLPFDPNDSPRESLVFQKVINSQ